MYCFFDNFDKSLIVLSATSGSISIASFATVVGLPVGIASESFSFTFSITIRIVKKLLKTTRNKKKKHNEIVMLARSKLNKTESKISETLIHNEISHEYLKTIINEKKNYLELKGKCKKNTENKIPRVQKLVIIKQCYYQNVLYVVLKNQDLLRNKKQVE